MEPFTPELLAISSALKWKGKDINPPPRHRQGEKFLKGPVPWNWIKVAGGLPGKAFHVAIAIWFLAGMMRKEKVRLSFSVLREMGIERNAYYRGLDQLEAAGLVSVNRQSGRLSVVTILKPKG